MSPSARRALRSYGVPLLVVAALATGGMLALLAHRREAARAPSPTLCSRAIDDAFGIDASRTSDAVLLDRLLAHRERCTSDAAYVDQVRRLLLDLQRLDDARALLDDAERRRGLTGDELAAQRAWVDLEESRVAEGNGDEARARAAHARATATVERLRARWPEWALPYTILLELRRSAMADGGTPSFAADPAALEAAARHRVANGAIVRSLTEPQALVVAFLAGVIGVIGLATAGGSAAFVRAVRRLETTTIAAAQPGYVELTGMLCLPPRAEAVIGPLTKHAGVWYAVDTNFGSKGSRTFRERSAQHFLLRDATGEIAIDPSGMTVHTRHAVTRFGNTGGVTSSRRTSERMLWEGDAAYVLGELAVVPVGGTTTRRLRLAEDGRPLIVSNYSEEELIARERRWIVFGLVLLLVSVATILWGAAQRYGVRTIPGVLE